MIELIKSCLVVNIIVLVILVVWVVVMGIWHFKREVKHKEEKADLQQSRDYHLKMLKQKIGIENEEGFDFQDK
jgi:FtsZ-interacting cell division protein ZipA